MMSKIRDIIDRIPEDGLGINLIIFSSTIFIELLINNIIVNYFLNDKEIESNLYWWILFLIPFLIIIIRATILELRKK